MQEAVKKPSPPPAVVLEIMPERFVKAVVERSLSFRTKTTQPLRKAMDAAIRSQVRLKGFRDASKAPRKQLVPAIISEIEQRSARLADAVVRVWDDSQRTLREATTKCLKQFDAEDDRPPVHADRGWTVQEWVSLRDRIVELHQELAAEEVALMLCVVTGKLPSAGYQEPEEGTLSPRFLRWIEELEQLPPDVPEWEEADHFAKMLRNLAAEKIDERDNAFTRQLEKLIDGVRDEFKDELRYLDVDMRSWFNEASARQATIPDALDVVHGITKELADYRSVRPQAPSREQERSRAGARERHEAAILGLIQRWNKLMEQPVDAPATEVQEARAPYGADSAEAGQPAAQQADLEKLRKEKGDLEARLKEAADAAALEKEQLSEEISQLKAGLAKAREDEQYWRAQYVDRSAETAGGEAGSAEDAVAALSSVKDVLAHAERAFPTQLRFALNGKSEKNAPYQKPQEVFQALAWLATEFYRVRPDPGAKVDFDRLIKESCPGWSYKPNQTETTMGMYPEWYRAVVDGRTYELANHIGKGAGFDPRNTIRIAFAWDDERRQVVIGYVGRHQRNRQS